MEQSAEKDQLLQCLDQTQNDTINLTESFAKAVKYFKKNSRDYCSKHCLYSKGVYVGEHKVRGVVCDGEQQWNILPCPNYQKQNEFIELCSSLLDFLRDCVNQVKEESESKASQEDS